MLCLPLPPSLFSDSCAFRCALSLCEKETMTHMGFSGLGIAVATAEGNRIAPRIWTMPASAVNCDVVSGQLGGKKTKGLFLLYFCIYNDFLKDFPFSFFVSCSTFFGWSVPSTMNKRQKKTTNKFWTVTMKELLIVCFKASLFCFFLSFSVITLV